jgi:glucose/arabinose dehydrogenase
MQGSTRLQFILLFAVATSLFSSCYKTRASRGGGQTDVPSERRINTADIAVPKGYKIEAVASGFTFPTAVETDDEGNLYVIEAGYSYGEVWDQPKLIKINKDGSKTTVATGEKNGPWSGITWHDGNFYIAEGGEMSGGRILKVSKAGTVTSLVDDLPSVGDHHTNGPVIKDGYIYFGQGTATNSGVVGEDNKEFGWLMRKPKFHDIPCADIVVTGNNYITLNPLTADSSDKAITGAYRPFGTPNKDGDVIKGKLPCSGSVLRIPLAGGKPELVAWGLRNPFGLAFSTEGNLYVTENGYDDRGSRPVWGTGDVLWKIEQGRWYGWPDHSAGKPIYIDNEYKVPGKDPIKKLLKNDPGTPPQPAAIFGVHSSANGIHFSNSDRFGYKGEAFVAEFGDMAPKTGKVLTPVGFKIVRVNVNTGVIRDFVVNKGKKNGPASWLGTGGIERPVSVKFDKQGGAMYIADFGIMKVTPMGPQPQLKTGVVWKVSRI